MILNKTETLNQLLSLLAFINKPMSNPSKSIHQFKVKRIDGVETNFSSYKNKVLLIVNIATGCGFAPQLKELQQLREELNDSDFEVLAFPSNDFGRQEPLDGQAIGVFCQLNHGVQFPIFQKSWLEEKQHTPCLNSCLKPPPRGGTSINT